MAVLEIIDIFYEKNRTFTFFDFGFCVVRHFWYAERSGCACFAGGIARYTIIVNDAYIDTHADRATATSGSRDRCHASSSLYDAHIGSCRPQAKTDRCGGANFHASARIATTDANSGAKAKRNV